MLKVDLARLEREGRLRLDAAIPPDDALWDESDMTFDGPVAVDLTAATTATGEVVVRGTVQGTIRHQCRRCLADVRTPLEEEVTLVFAPPDELGGEEDDEIRTLPARARDLELGPPLREELILAVDPWVVCDEACRGLCPQCGVNLNEETCDCTLEERDPRWDALRALKNE